MLSVRVHPRFSIYYYAFYLEGLGRLFGHDALVFDRGDLPESTEYDDGLAFQIESSGSPRRVSRRVYVSANDFARYDTTALAWCDSYGMVNHDPATAARTAEPGKILPIGPSFGIREWGSLARTAGDAARLLAHSDATPRKRFDELRALRKQFVDRLPERRYVPGRSLDDYVFFVGWPWKKHPEVNPSRARFMRACKASGVRFEGGFAPRRRKDIEGLDDITAERHYSFRDWVRKTQSSALVFNCPAVHQCFGWKLGEFLALGKAILSTPLSRQMPSPLVHGEHVHYVEDDPAAMRDGIDRLLRDRDYRNRLERGARRYYLDYLAPERVVARLVDA